MAIQNSLLSKTLISAYLDIPSADCGLKNQNYYSSLTNIHSNMESIMEKSYE